MVERKFAVLGDPIAHSKSPAIHQAAYQVLGLDWSYEAIQVPAGSLVSFLSEHADYSGFSLTMPLKAEALKWAQGNKATLSDTVLATNSANTLLNNTRPALFNTDVFGATEAMAEVVPSDTSRVAFLGAGATARSVLLAASKFFPGLSEVVIFSRRSEQAEELERILDRAEAAKVALQWLPLEAAADFGGADLTINTLPPEVAKQFEVDVPLRGGYVFDVTYSGSSAFNGEFPKQNQVQALSMLVWQALAQIRLFLNGDDAVELPNEVQVLQAMRNAAL